MMFMACGGGDSGASGATDSGPSDAAATEASTVTDAGSGADATSSTDATSNDAALADDAEASVADGSDEVDAEVDAGPCGTSGTCVPAAPAGWTGPVLVYAGAGAPPACPATTTVALSGGNGLVAPAATCTTCECDLPTSPAVTCSAPTLTMKTGSSLSGCSASSANCGTPQTIGTTCTEVNPSCEGMYQGGTLSAPTPSAGTCSASMQSPTVTPPQWTTNVELCASTATPSTCGANAVCLEAEAPSSAFHTCVYHAGDVACPDSTWIGKVTMSPGLTDDRGCSSCGCDAIACVGGVVGNYFGDATCSAVAPPLTYSLPQSSCVDIETDQSGVAVYVKLKTPPAPSCGTPTGGTPTGSAQANPPTTVCCL
jgi:hypothetical protein